jgi:CO/xanthine dehydrogenase Mo-binding subunit
MEGTAAFGRRSTSLPALELDPLELRRRNHADVDQASGLPYSSKQLLACYDRAAELAGWGKSASAPGGGDGLLRGMGATRSGGAAAARRTRRFA